MEEVDNTERQPRVRVWQRMLSGKKLDLVAPQAADIEPCDIARGLSRLPRWNGQTQGNFPYSVAQHCLLVEEIVGFQYANIARHWRLAALLHDAAEYVIGDMIAPFKNLIGNEYQTTELKITSAVHSRFQLQFPLPLNIEKIIKHADKQSAFVEAVQIAGFSVVDARSYIYTEGFQGDKLPLIEDISPHVVEQRFLKRLDELF